MQKVVVRNPQIYLPTTAKLFGSLGLALTGFFNAAMMLPYLPAGTRVGGLAIISASFGLLLGWRVIGMQPGQGMWRAAERGMRAAFYLIICATLFLGALQMLHQSTRHRYDGPMEAITDIVAQGLDLGFSVLQLDVVAVLFFGGVLSSMLAEWAWRRWQ